GNAAVLVGMFELAMTTFRSDSIPTIGLQPPDDVPNLHSVTESATSHKLFLHLPRQRFIKPIAELQVVAAVDDAVAVEVEGGFIASGIVEGGAEGDGVARVDVG